jgi:sugar O-acyltransferase (sialic acid O-acetyltransferase NeuD family)
MHILGAGGHAKVVIDILKINNIEISGIWDDKEASKGFNDLFVNGKIADLDSDETYVIIAIGNNHIRKSIAEKFKYKFGIAVHPSSVISPSAKLLEGTVVMPNVAVNASSFIGKHVILNTGCVVDHDCKIGDYAHISPQAALTGGVEVGEGTNIGVAACVIPGIKIGKWAIIGAGTVVISDVPDYAVVVGNPGRIIKYNPI